MEQLVICVQRVGKKTAPTDPDFEEMPSCSADSLWGLFGEE